MGKPELTTIWLFQTTYPRVDDSLSLILFNCKIRHASSTWKELIRKSLCLPLVRNITEIVKKIRSLYGFGGRCNKITDVCMDL